MVCKLCVRYVFISLQMSLQMHMWPRINLWGYLNFLKCCEPAKNRTMLKNCSKEQNISHWNCEKAKNKYQAKGDNTWCEYKRQNHLRIVLKTWKYNKKNSNAFLSIILDRYCKCLFLQPVWTYSLVNSQAENRNKKGIIRTYFRSKIILWKA